MLGPEHPTPDWQYDVCHRHGVVVSLTKPGAGVSLDARNLTAPFIPGALRGGSHFHVWDGQGAWVSFTYEDHLLAHQAKQHAGSEMNLRNIGVSVPIAQVRVSKDHPRNQDGQCFSVLVTRATDYPKPGSDDIRRACEEGWVGANGYKRSDGSWQRRALAFQGQVITASGEPIYEVFIVDLPENVTIPAADGPLGGTEKRRPLPPKGVSQRRLTFTIDRKFPGLQGPRHWMRSSLDGSRIAFLMRDEQGILQLWTVSPNGGAASQLTRNAWPISSTFSWSPDGRWLAHMMDRSVCVTDTDTGDTKRLTESCGENQAPRPESCVFSPDSSKIAFVRQTTAENRSFNQIFVLTLGW
jgi:hypothetical protein